MIELAHGDCLEIMKEIPDNFIDMVCCDMPYGITACKWDSVLPLPELWEQYIRICKDNAAIVLNSSQPFTSALIMSNPKIFEYHWIWNKKVASNSQLVKYQPLKIHEEIVVFCKTTPKYYPQNLIDCDYVKSNKNRSGGVGHISSEKKRENFIQKKTNYPKSIIEFKPHNINKEHPTQKPIELIEYLIKTYSSENDIVLDNCMGSGTTGVACKNLNRNFIGIEKEKTYFDIAKLRIGGGSHEIIN